MPLAIAEPLAEVIDRLETGRDREEKLKRLVERELWRRLAEYELIDRCFQQKYGMILEEFEARYMLEELGYSFEAESDYHDWDMAMDGIEMFRRDLEEL